MQDSKPCLDSMVKDDDLARPKSREGLTDRLAVRASLLVLCVGLLLAAIWVIDRPSFEKCSALENVTQRYACYDQLRSELLKPPAK